MKRISAIDIFRGISILLTLSIHLGPNYITRDYSTPTANYIWFKLWDAGAYGVPMFFLISGYLITRIIAEEPNGLFKPDLRSFYSRRIARIAPLLLAICLIGVFIISLIPPSQYATKRVVDCFYNQARPITSWMWVSIATFSLNWYKIVLGKAHCYFGQHWDSLWSLSVEEEFYFFYPLVLRKLASKKNLYIFLTTIIFIGPFLQMMNYYGHFKIDFFDQFEHFGMIALGCLLYLIQNEVRPYLKTIDCWFLCFHGLFILGLVFFHSHALVYVWLPIWAEPLIGLGLFLFLLGGMNLNFFESKIWKPLTWAGELSYGAYLLHIVVLFFLWDLFSRLGHFEAFGIFCLVTLILSKLSYVYFEKPMNKLIRKWIDP